MHNVAHDAYDLLTGEVEARGPLLTFSTSFSKRGVVSGMAPGSPT